MQIPCKLWNIGLEFLLSVWIAQMYQSEFSVFPSCKKSVASSSKYLGVCFSYNNIGLINQQTNTTAGPEVECIALFLPPLCLGIFSLMIATQLQLTHYVQDKKKAGQPSTAVSFYQGCQSLSTLLSRHQLKSHRLLPVCHLSPWAIGRRKVSI